MYSVRYFILSVLLLSLPLSAVAETKMNFDIKQLSSLFDKYKRKQAYHYASQYLAEQEGDPFFDYYYGVSAIDSGHASQGVFALERVLLIYPEDSVARLELARGYFVLQEYARSRQEFEQVLATAPPDSVKRTAYLYLDKIRLEEARYKTTISGFVELGAGYDSNVNSAPVDGFNGLPDPDSVEQGDSIYNAVAQFKVEYPFSPGWKLNTVATGILKKNQDLDQFDTLAGTLQTGVSLRSKASLYNMDIVAQEFQLDGEGYRSLTGLSLGWKYDISEISNFTTSLQYAKLEYDEFSILDSDLITLNMGYTQQFSVRFAPVFFTNVKLGLENAKSDENAAQSDTERDIYSLRLGMAFSLSPKFILQTVAGIQNSKYAGDNFLITNGGQRKDDYLNADINLLWLISYKWRLDTRIAYVENTSNIDIREYDRLLTSINLNYSY